MQAKAGYRPDATPSSQPRTPIGDNRDLADTMNDNTLPRGHSIDPQLEVCITYILPPCIGVAEYWFNVGYYISIFEDIL